MRIVGRIDGTAAASRNPASPLCGRAREPDAALAGTALITVEPIARVEQSGGLVRRPLAAFVAQLIATQRSAPQTRARRRAAPAEALAVYAAASPAPTASGRVLMRSL